MNAPAMMIPPPGLTVRTIREGVERIHITGEPAEEPAMPRGVYERKPKNPESAAPKRRGRPPKAAKASPKVQGGSRYAELLEQMRRDRDALNAAIAAVEAL